MNWLKKIGMGLAVLHLLIMFVYLSPTAWLSKQFVYWSTVYAFPMWHMSAKLFSPMADSYVYWEFEDDWNCWRKLDFVPDNYYRINQRLNFKIGQFMAYENGHLYTDKQLRLSKPQIYHFRYIKVFLNGRRDTVEVQLKPIN